MILLTGASGFIGYNILKSINSDPFFSNHEVIVIDKDDGKHLINNKDINFSQYINFEDIDKINALDWNSSTIIFHLGACSDTTETNSAYLKKMNLDSSKFWLEKTIDHSSTLLYASSASVYGDRPEEMGSFSEFDKKFPINLYAKSKADFDDYLLNTDIKSATIFGLRYFNVFGPGEDHKKNMCSPIMHFCKQAIELSELRVFSGYDEYSSKSYKRDFIYIEDAVNLTISLAKKGLQKSSEKEIFNIGSGQSHSFYKIAEIVAAEAKKYVDKDIKIKEVPFPNHLKNKYQHFTKASQEKICKEVGDYQFTSFEDSVKNYANYLFNKN